MACLKKSKWGKKEKSKEIESFFFFQRKIKLKGRTKRGRGIGQLGGGYVKINNLYRNLFQKCKYLHKQVLLLSGGGGDIHTTHTHIVKISSTSTSADILTANYKINSSTRFAEQKNFVNKITLRVFTFSLFVNQFSDVKKNPLHPETKKKKNKQHNFSSFTK